jgi:ankyrin repeat protein
MLDGITKLAEEGDQEGVRRLLEHGTYVDIIDNGQFNVTPLQVAARSGHLGIVVLLLGRGANVNHVDHDGLSPVTSAARAGKWSVVKVLAEHGGDFRTCDGNGKTGYDYLRRCRGKRNRAAIEAVLARRSPAPASDETAADRPA